MKSTLLKTLGIAFVVALAFSSCRNEDNKIEPTCFDEVQNQGELGVDCGGPCAECPPSCENGIVDGDEVLPDCGGSDCVPCATCEDGIQNAHWVYDPNLTSADIGKDSVGVTANGTLLRLVMEKGIDCGYPCPNYCEPTCEDGIQNGDELGVDCGGSCENPCPPPNCFDGIQNGQETGVDCGAPGCPDCTPPTCDDGIQNIHIEYVEPSLTNPEGYLVVVETGIDCDNNFETSCPDCPIPTCFDGIKNGDETGIDCGGSCGTACDPTPVCGNGFQDGDEAGIDCDFDDATPCPPCATCEDGILNGPEFEIDCVDYPIPEYPCEQCISCHDGIQNQKELDLDCGGPNCESCLQFLSGEIDGATFMDQYLFNSVTSIGIEDPDTLYVPNALTLSVTQGFDPKYRLLTGIQQIETTSGTLQRTLEVWLPDFNLLEVGNDPIDLMTYSPGLTKPPTVRYTEGFIDGPNQGMTTYQTTDDTEPSDPDDNLTIDYKFEVMPDGYGYIGGTISFTRLKPFPNLPGSVEITAEDIEFRVEYNPYQ